MQLELVVSCRWWSLLLYKDLKQQVICPTVDINEGVCKDLGSHKGEHGQQEPGSNLQFTPFWLDQFYCGYSSYRIW